MIERKDVKHVMLIKNLKKGWAAVISKNGNYFWEMTINSLNKNLILNQFTQAILSTALNSYVLKYSTP